MPAPIRRIRRSVLPEPAAPVVTTNVLPGEIIVRGKRLTISASASIPGGRSSVSLTGGGAVEALTVDGALVVVDTSQLPAGRHVLTVDGLTDAATGEATLPLTRDFIVIDTPATIDDDVAILHASRVRVTDLTVHSLPFTAVDGSFIDVLKVVSRTGDHAIELAFDEKGARVAYDAVLAELAERRRNVYGKLEPALCEQLAAGGTVEVAIWLSLEASGVGEKAAHLPEKSERRALRRAPALEREMAKVWAAAAERTLGDARQYGLEEASVDRAAPVLYGRMPADAVPKLAESPLVAAIFARSRDGETDLGDSIAVHNSDDAHARGFTGAGVRVGVYEEGVDTTADLQIDGQYDSSPNTTSHARLTHAIIKNIQKNRPHGHAPDASLFSANSYDLDAARWAVQDQSCTVISQSFHRAAEQTSDQLSFDDTYKDWLALHFPYPTFSEAAGNGTSTEFVNHKGFNRLTVGSHNDDATAMASDSVFRNPASTHGDRELPELSANGMGVTAAGLTNSGTSFAAPAVAGAVAVIQSAAGVLRSWPEGCRAILMAAAWRNPSAGRWRADLTAGVDGRDGAGALDTDRAVTIARSRQSRDNAGTGHGWDVGTFRSSDVGADGVSVFRYRITTPRWTFGFGTHVKVALAWDSNVRRTDLLFLSIFQNTLSVDLDLQVHDSAGTLVAWSASWNNSYEIAEFDARSAETYEVTIRRWSGTDDVWYGIAWSLNNGLLDILGQTQTAPVFG